MAPDLTRGQDLIWVSEQIHPEGIAELINIPAQMKKPETSMSSPEKRYLDYYRTNAEIIRTVDGLLAGMQENPANRRDLASKATTAVPLSDHPTGFFMAGTIAKELGEDARIELFPIFSPSSRFTMMRRRRAPGRRRPPPGNPWNCFVPWKRAPESEAREIFCFMQLQKMIARESLRNDSVCSITNSCDLALEHWCWAGYGLTI